METDKKKRIDEILHKCSILMSNVGMNTEHDVGTRTKAKQIEREWLQEIKTIDPELYKILDPGLPESEMLEKRK